MIRISRLTDYASLLMAHLATCTEVPLHTAAQLSEETALPLPTVSKVLKVLVRAELLVSHRGVRGGYRLARSPEKITVAEIIRAVEGPIAITECSVHVDGSCEVESWCPVMSNWQQINNVVRDALDGVTLAQLAGPCGTRHSPLVQLGTQNTGLERDTSPVES